MQYRPLVRSIMQFPVYLSILLCLYLMILPFNVAWFSKRPAKFAQPILQSGKPQPILTILEPNHKTKVHIVGVSHGSLASTILVDKTIRSVNPRCVVLELCDDRFFSISVEKRLPPRTENSTLVSLYHTKVAALESIAPTSSSGKFVWNVKSFARFLNAQGPIIGSFVIMGAVVSSLQRWMRPTNDNDDEFSIAMRSAYELNIPLRMGDAPQSETLESIKRLFSAETFLPKNIIADGKSFAFSALGIDFDDLPWKSTDMFQKFKLDSAEWISIPGVYAQNKALLSSLTPIAIILVLSTISGSLLPVTSEAISLLPPLVNDNDVTEMTSIVETIVGTTHAPTAALTAVGEVMVTSVNTGWEWLQLVTVAKLPPFAEKVATFLVDALAVLFMIRLSKLIGADRDRIICHKIQDVCREFPNSEIVVVLGMLHCNGVASWLLSGEDPLTVSSSSSSSSSSNSTK